MRYLEDLIVGATVDCGSFSFSREEIISFARRYDPQPFHLDDEAAGRSLFGRLTASGLHSACAGRRLVLQNAMQDVSFIDSPGVKRMQMHRPVYPEFALRVSHTIRQIEWLDDWPGVGLVAALTQGIDTAGNLVMAMDDLNWVGSRALSNDFNAASLRMSQRSSMALGALRCTARIDPSAAQLGAGEPLYFEDCRVDSAFCSSEHEVTAGDIAAFHAAFDPLVPNHGSRLFPNEWHGTCLAIRVLSDAFWSHMAAVGGSGTDFVRWPVCVQAGDRLRGQLRVTQVRPLRTRPGTGLVKGDCLCVNQRSEVVSSFSVTAFIRMRTAEI